jgi:hypothetical protein
MGIIKDLFNKDRVALVKENEKIRRHKKNIERELEEQKLANEEVKDKYIALLEEKCDGFNKYLHYEEEAKKYADKWRELKKELAEAKEK